MADREAILRTETLKGEFDGETDELARRVFHVLSDDKSQQAQRNSTLIALLVEHLQKKKLISDSEIDGLLLKVVGRL